MKLPVPLTDVNQPSVDEISQAFNEKVKKDDLKTWHVIYSLYLTEKSALWHEADECNHSIGMMWKACRGYMPAALKYIYACNLNVQPSKSKLISTKKCRALPTQNSISKKCKSVSPEKRSPSPQNSELLSPSQKGLPSPQKVKSVMPSPKNGRKFGNKNWSMTEINTLLDATELVLPCGKEMWEKCALECLAD